MYDAERYFYFQSISEFCSTVLGIFRTLPAILLRRLYLIAHLMTILYFCNLALLVKHPQLKDLLRIARASFFSA